MTSLRTILLHQKRERCGNFSYATPVYGCIFAARFTLSLSLSLSLVLAATVAIPTSALAVRFDIPQGTHALAFTVAGVAGESLVRISKTFDVFAPYLTYGKRVTQAPTPFVAKESENDAAWGASPRKVWGQVAQVASAETGSIGERIGAWLCRIFGTCDDGIIKTLTHTQNIQNTAIQPPLTSVTAERESATTTVSNQYITHPVATRAQSSVTIGVDENTLNARLASLRNDLLSRISLVSAGSGGSTSYVPVYLSPTSDMFVTRELFDRQTNALIHTIGMTGRIDNLSGVNLNNVTVSGVSGLTDANIPDSITVSNYLPLAGGTLTGALTGTNLTLSGDLTVSGAQTLYGAITIPYLTATSTSATSSFAGPFSIGSTTPHSASLFAVGTSTSLFHIDKTTGNIGIGETSPGSKLSVSGGGSFGSGYDTTAAPTNGLIVEGNIGIGTTTPYAKLSVDGRGVFNQDVRANYFTATSTSVASTFPYASSTAITISGTASTSNLIASTGFTFKTVTGFLKATAGVVATALVDLTSDITGTLGVGNGGTGATSFTSGNLIYGSGSNALQSVATTTLSLGTGLTYSGTLGALVGGADGTLSLSGVAPSSLSLTKGNFIVGDDAGVAQATSSVFVSSTGKVGVGTAVPGEKFEVFASSGATGLRIRSNSGNVEKYIDFYSDNGQFGRIAAYGRSSVSDKPRMSFYLWNSDTSTVEEKLRITDTGNVGIGTTSPYAKLSVVGEAVASHFTATSTTATTILAGGLNVGSGGLVYDRSTGNVGIGTTTPWLKLSVTGTVGFDGLTAGAGAGSLCLTADNEVVYSNAAGCTGSSERFKHDIVSLDGASGIEEAMKLNPVSFMYNDDIGVRGSQVGFIAEEVAQVDDRLVTYDAGGTPVNVKYQNMVAVVVKAVQEMWSAVDELKDKVASILGRLAGHDSQIAALEARIAALEGSGGPESATASPGDSSGAVDTEAPVITINGNNPAEIEIGAAYSDLGATVTDNVNDNLGYQTFLGSTPMELAHLDTSEPNEWHIYYVATDSAGNTATSTRTVIVDGALAPNADIAVPDVDARDESSDLTPPASESEEVIPTEPESETIVVDTSADPVPSPEPEIAPETPQTDE